MLTIKAVSIQLGVSPALVYREIHQGRLKAHRFAKRTYRISQGHLDEYIAASGIGQTEAIANPEQVPQNTSPNKLTVFKHVNVTRLLSSQS